MESGPLTILDAGYGLFGTHVTLEDVNASIKEHVETVNELTLDSKMEVIGDGNGFSSKVILISCVWSLPSEELPQKIVLKIVSFAHSKGAIKKSKTEDEKKMAEHYETAILRIHNQEVNFYEVLKTGDSQRLLAPKVYFCQRFSDSNRIKGFIGMEYVERTEVRHSFENCTSEEIQPILKAIAGVQALSLLVSNEELEKIKTGSLYKEIMVAMIVREGTKGILGHLEGKYPGKFTERIGRLESYESNILNYEKAFKLNKHLGIQHDVFVHGDLWSANILWAQGDNTIHFACKILDYQLAHVGNPAEDLVRLLTTCLSGADRQEHWEQLLEQFYEYFLGALGNNREEVPYTLSQLKESYRQFYPVGGMLLLNIFCPGADFKLQTMEETEAEGYRMILEEKIECLLEDVEKFYCLFIEG
ncbi:unnamed protein product [Caenorhabditis brenneri]